jgi:hypothetical protein
MCIFRAERGNQSVWDQHMATALSDHMRTVSETLTSQTKQLNTAMEKLSSVPCEPVAITVPVQLSTTPILVNARSLRRGDRVVRGPDWKWENQDGGPDGRGCVKGSNGEGWVKVEWENGQTNSYRMGADGAYDLSLCIDTTAFAELLRENLDRIRPCVNIGDVVTRGDSWLYGDQVCIRVGFHCNVHCSS